MCTLFPAIYPLCQRAQNVHLCCVTFYPPLSVSDFVSSMFEHCTQTESCRVILGRAAAGAGGKQSSKCAWEFKMRFGSSVLCFVAEKAHLKGSFLHSKRWEITVTLLGLEFIHAFLLIETRIFLPLQTSQFRSVWCEWLRCVCMFALSEAGQRRETVT